MGLLDTVGAEGIPSIRFHAAPSEIWKYPYDFHDTDVSSEVQHVFQAAATHDRFAPFQPCPVRRSSALVAAGTAEEGYNKGDKYKGVKYSLREVWFPGMPNNCTPRTVGTLLESQRVCKSTLAVQITSLA
jgi:hypothetical protein